MEIIKEFPRVVVFDHRDIFSQGCCIRKLIEAVETEWFVYLHCDVYLPEGWMEKMNNYREKYDWIESKQHQTVLQDFPLPYAQVPERSFSGGQLGKTAILKKAISVVDDDYLFRTEDIIISNLVKGTNSRCGRTEDVYLHHQSMARKSKRKMKIKFMHCIFDWDRDEEIFNYETMAKSLVKYMKPEDAYVIQTVQTCLQGLVKHEATTMEEIEDWVKQTNPEWLPVLFANKQDCKARVPNAPQQETLKGLQETLLKLSEMIEKKMLGDCKLDEFGHEAVERLKKKAAELIHILSIEYRM
jgi:hypothetical protein